MVKLNNLMLKIIGKLPASKEATSQGAHHIRLDLSKAHPLLHTASIVVLGADVIHEALGISIAGVVASCDEHFSTYHAELRAQQPFVEGQQRGRKSQERIIDLADMVEQLLSRRRDHQGGELPSTVLYFRDGVSDGQFAEVMRVELNMLVEAFRRVGGQAYSPRLAIIVAQKRHHTRLFPGEGSADCDEHGNVLPGTVAGRGIARPGHINFYLVAHKGQKGTSVPCHLHLLHLDDRFRGEGVGVDAVERICYDLCHLYPRADKTVSYPAPAYLADHLCERGRLYLEGMLPEAEPRDPFELAAREAGPPEAREEAAQRIIGERVRRLNELLGTRRGCALQGLSYFC